MKEHAPGQSILAQTKLEMGMKATKLAQAKNLNPEIHIPVVDKGGKLEINEEYVE